jgi:hypothetical protein
MLNNITRTSVIQVWLAAVALVVVAAVAFGEMRVSTTTFLLTLRLVTPVIVFLLWPEAQSLPAADVIRGTDRRT